MSMEGGNDDDVVVVVVVVVLIQTDMSSVFVEMRVR